MEEIYLYLLFSHMLSPQSLILEVSFKHSWPAVYMTALGLNVNQRPDVFSSVCLFEL